MPLFKNYLFLTLFIIFIIFSYFYFSRQHTKYKGITTFDNCVAAGFKVLPTYPEKCILPGKIFINPTQEKKQQTPVEQVPTLTVKDVYKNLSYYLDGQTIEMKDGRALFPANALVKRATSTIQITNEELLTDVNNDTVSDLVFLMKDTEASTSSLKSPISYLSAAISLNSGYTGINVIAVGTTFSSSTIHYENNKIIVQYSDATSLIKRKYFILEKNILKEVSTK